MNVEKEPWTAALLLKDTVVPQELTIKREHGRKPRAEDQRLKNAHVILSRCGFLMYVDMVVQHYRSKWTVLDVLDVIEQRETAHELDANITQAEIDDALSKLR